MSQSELAEKFKITTTSYGRWEALDQTLQYLRQLGYNDLDRFAEKFSGI